VISLAFLIQIKDANAIRLYLFLLVEGRANT